MAVATFVSLPGSDALRALGGQLVDPVHGIDPTAGTPVLRVAADPIAADVLDRLQAHVEAGGRLIVAVAPATGEVLDAGLAVVRRFATVTVDDELVGVSGDDPLLADARLLATTTAGRVLHLDRVRPLQGAGDVLATAPDGRAIARRVTVGAGTVTVLGTDCLLHDRWLTWPDNVGFLAEALHDGPAPNHVGERVDAIRGPVDRGAPHCTPPVVVATPWLDDAVVAATTPDTLLRTAGHLARVLPAAVHDALVDFADAPHPSGALLLRAMPVGQVPPTPSTPTTGTGKDLTSELSLLTVARRLGQPVGYLPEHGGTVVQNILPTPVAADRQVSTSSKVELMFHTEAAFHPHRPRYLVLLCLRGDPDGEARTTLASIRELLPRLPLRVRRVLFEPRFRTAADESYVGGRPTQLGAPVAVLTGAWDSPSMVFDADLMVGTDDEADRALQALAAAVREHHTGVVLQAGDILVVDNTVAVHGRSPFRARFDGTDRWLQRAFVVADLALSAGDRTGRIITTRFAK